MTFFKLAMLWTVAALLVGLAMWRLLSPSRRGDAPFVRQVFVSYRRTAAGLARELVETLQEGLPSAKILRDKSALEVGVDFPAALQQTIAKSDAVVLLVHPTWDKGKRGRLDQPTDFIRMELLATQDKSRTRIPVIVVQCDQGRLPEDLPRELSFLHDAPTVTGPSSNFMSLGREAAQQIIRASRSSVQSLAREVSAVSPRSRRLSAKVSVGIATLAAAIASSWGVSQIVIDFTDLRSPFAGDLLVGQLVNAVLWGSLWTCLGLLDTSPSGTSPSMEIIQTLRAGLLRGWCWEHVRSGIDLSRAPDNWAPGLIVGTYPIPLVLPCLTVATLAAIVPASWAVASAGPSLLAVGVCVGMGIGQSGLTTLDLWALRTHRGYLGQHAPPGGPEPDSSIFD